VGATPAPVHMRVTFVDVSTPKLSLVGNSVEVPFVLADMTWWRLRPLGTDRIEASYSGDGRTWTVLGTRPTFDAPTARQITIGVSAPAGMVGFEIEALNQCPP
jgi:hypothetical protein